MNRPTLALGLDVQSTNELRQGRTFKDLRSVFTPGEFRHCEHRADPIQSLTGILAAKKAFLKCVSQTICDSLAIACSDIEILYARTGRPFYASEATVQFACPLQSHLSITHSGTTAAAIALLSW